MIPKGNQRGGGRQLATHLLNTFDNDLVEVLEVRGSVAQDLHGAFSEWFAQSKATKATKPYYSLSINPDFDKYQLTREQYIEFIERVERGLKLVNQPRAVVVHVKKSKHTGQPREHMHCVWSRIQVGPEKCRAVHMAKDHMALRRVTQQFARDYGLELPPGLRQDGRKQRFNDRAKQSNLKEKQQEERSGITKQERMDAIAFAWYNSLDGPSFVAAMAARGYTIARGDRRALVVVDRAGEVHSLTRQLKGVANAAQLRERLGAAYAPEKLPGAQEAIRAAEGQKQKQPEKLVEPPTPAQRREEFDKRQTARRAPLIEEKAKLLARHEVERQGLADLHQSENRGVLSARAFQQPKGLRAFLTRITGFQMLIGIKHRRQDVVRAADQDKQKDALVGRHDREKMDVERRLRDLDAIDARERRSLETVLKRQRLQKALHPPQPKIYGPPLKPIFDRAADPANLSRSEEGGKQPPVRATEAFNRKKPAAPLPNVFERAADPKPVPPSPPPVSVKSPAVDPALEEARRLREEIERSRPRRGPAQDRDRDRER